jgi:hypothetical protein
MKFKLRILPILFWIFAAFAALAPVCVLSGGDSATIGYTIELSDGALVEVKGDNAEVRVSGVRGSAIEISVTMNNAEFIDFYTQILAGNPARHLVISAATSEGAATTANSVIEIGIPAGVELIIQTTSRPILVDAVSLTTASLSTSDGKISVNNSSGDFDLNTTNAEVTVQAVDGPVNISTTNAHVWFEGVVDEGSNSISTTNGDIAVRLGGGSNVSVTGTTHNGDVTVNGASDYEGLVMQGDAAAVTYRVDDGAADLNITNGPGAIHINPDVIAVFDGDG